MPVHARASSMIEIKTIGYVDSCFPDKFGTPRQPGLVTHSTAFLRINKKFQPQFSLEGLDGFSHLWVIFYFHKNKSARFHAKVHPPRLNGKTIGLFATRSPHRPNPIGLSLVEINKIESDGIWVKGIDIIDKTPILDIKPYLPEIEAKPKAKGGWTEHSTHTKLKLTWSQDAKNQLLLHEKDKQKENLKSLVEELLLLDPRPQVYKGYEGEKSPYRHEHAIRIFDLDVHFKFTEPELILITALKKN